MSNKARDKALLDIMDAVELVRQQAKTEEQTRILEMIDARMCCDNPEDCPACAGYGELIAQIKDDNK